MVAKFGQRDETETSYKLRRWNVEDKQRDTFFSTTIQMKGILEDLKINSLGGGGTAHTEINGARFGGFHDDKDSSPGLLGCDAE
jgi:hypothetical protein